MTTAAPRSARCHVLVLCLAACLAIASGSAGAQEPPAPESQAPAESGPEAPPLPDAPRYVKGASRTFEDVASDLFYWGQSATMTGHLLDNVFVGGQLVTVDGGTVGGDLFAFAANTTIAGEVMGDVYTFSSQVRVAEGAVIHGNLTAYAGTLQIHGTVGGHVLGGGGGTVIDGDVGPVKIEAGSLTVTDRAVVHGDLEYESNNEAEIAEGARIEGTVSRSQAEEEGEPAEAGIGVWDLAWALWRYLGALIVGTVLLLVGGGAAREPARVLGERPASGLGFGFVVAVVYPIACLVAIVLIVSLPLGVLGLLLYALLLFVSGLVAAQFLGAWVLRRLAGRSDPSPYLSLALGLALLVLVSFIPYLGFLIRLVAVILGLGGIYLALRRYGFPSTGGDAVARAPLAAPTGS